MITDQDIGELLQIPKRIGAKTPSSGYREENGHRRCDLLLQAVSDEGTTFMVFVRQNSKFIENFSIGLRYQTGDKMLGTITLVRYNGPHGEVNRYGGRSLQQGTHPPHNRCRDSVRECAATGEP